MKSKSAFLVGCLVFVVLVVVAFNVGYRLMKVPGPKGIASESWLVLDPQGMVPDYNEIRSSGFWNLGPVSSEEICRRIRRAAIDPKVKGILIKPGITQISYANLNEIAAALKDFKARRKPVLAHGEMLAQRDYLLCSMADKVNMEPSASAGLLLEGVSANMLFFKNTLAKLGIKMHVMQAGKYKGASEPYNRTSFSPETEANLRQVLKGRYDLILDTIGRYRQLDTLAVREIFETRPDLFITADEAMRYGLIDQALTWDSYAAENGITPEKTVSIRKYNSETLQSSTNRIAVLNLSGNIAPVQGFTADGLISSGKVDKVVRQIQEDPSIKAVILRVNSPGGSALESELIYQKLQTLKIPVVVSMGGMAASGGYYVSCAGDYIFADPYTITGSIGVVMALPEAEELGNKIGLDSQTLSYGKFAKFGSIFEAYDQEILDSFQRSADSVYAEFQERVMTARKIAPENMEAVAEGRVFTAAAAKANGLIDEIGGLDAAIKKAAELAKITNYTTQQYPRQISWFEMFREGGWWEMAQKVLSQRDISLSERLQAYLEQTLKPRHWLYFCPYALD